jgi:hypothetical protein
MDPVVFFQFELALVGVGTRRAAVRPKRGRKKQAQ